MDNSEHRNASWLLLAEYLPIYYVSCQSRLLSLFVKLGFPNSLSFEIMRSSGFFTSRLFLLKLVNEFLILESECLRFELKLSSFHLNTTLEICFPKTNFVFFSC